MTKKIIAVLLALAMVFTLAACGVVAGKTYKACTGYEVKAFGTVGKDGKDAVVSGVNFETCKDENGKTSKEFDDAAVSYTYIVTNKAALADYKDYLKNEVFADLKPIINTEEVSLIKDILEGLNVKNLESLNKVDLIIYQVDGESFFAVINYAIGGVEFVLISPDAATAFGNLLNPLFKDHQPK